jgi:nucleoside-diphosphate-sugar epimerase
MTAAARSFQRALVTGCAGFLGSHLCQELVGRGVEVLGVDRFSDYYDPLIKEHNIEALLDEPRFELARRDLAADQLDDLLEGVDAVFHLAARAGVRGSFGASFAEYLHDNLLATQRLLEASVGRDLRALVYASSSSVYGHVARPVTESAQRRAVSAYGATKMAVEDLAQLYHRTEGLPVVGLRYFTAYGPKQRPDMAFSRFIAHALRREPIPVYGDGSQLRDFTYVEDVIDATVAAAELGRPGLLYNVGAGTPSRLLDAISMLQELLGLPISVHHVASMRGDARHTNCDGTRAAIDLGFKPSWDVRSGLARQVEWTLEVAAANDHAAANGHRAREIHAAANVHAPANGDASMNGHASAEGHGTANGKGSANGHGSANGNGSIGNRAPDRRATRRG